MKKNKLNTKYIDGLAEKYRKNPTEKNKKAWYIAINQWSERHQLKYTDSRKGQTVLVI